MSWMKSGSRFQTRRNNGSWIIGCTERMGLVVMSIFDLLKSWDGLGGAVQQQAIDVYDGEPLCEMNPNALRYIRDWAEDWYDEYEDIASLYEVLSDESTWDKQPEDEDEDEDEEVS